MSSSTAPILLDKTPFEELVTAPKNTVFGLTSTYGVSIIRDVTTVTSGGTITGINGELRLLTDTTGASSAILDTVQTGVYIAGKAAEWGVGLRIPTAPTGNQFATWGLLNDENGYFWGVNATGQYVGLRRNSTDTTIAQSNWNLDKLDGTGSSGIDLDDYSNRGVIYQCDFAWYGYGGILFKVAIPTALGNKVIPVHFIQPAAGQNSIIDPNLPIRVRIGNGGTTSAFSVFTGGRQYSIYGNYVPQSRPISAFRLDFSTSNGLWYPAMVFRKKATFQGRENSVNAALRGFTALSTDRSHLIGVFIEDTTVITGGSFVQPANIPTNETGLEVNTTATATYTPSANALLIYLDVVGRDLGVNNTVLQELERQNFTLPLNKHLVIAVRPINGNGSIDYLTAIMRELR